jgi:hypothetical protein
LYGGAVIGPHNRPSPALLVSCLSGSHRRHHALGVWAGGPIGGVATRMITHKWYGGAVRCPYYIARGASATKPACSFSRTVYLPFSAVLSATLFFVVYILFDRRVGVMPVPTDLLSESVTGNVAGFSYILKPAKQTLTMTAAFIRRRGSETDLQIRSEC